MVPSYDIVKSRRSKKRRKATRRSKKSEKGQKDKRLNISDRRGLQRRKKPLSDLDRRAEPRINLPFSLALSIRNKDQAIVKIEKITTKGKDISRRGVSLESKEKLPINAPLYICCHLPELFIPVQLNAELKWRTFNSTTKLYTYGISLENSEPEYLYVWNEFIQKLLSRKKSFTGKIAYSLESFFYNKVVRSIVRVSTLGAAGLNSKSDSGVIFDHIYKNTPKGKSKVGSFIDLILLNLPASKATRNRKENFIDLIRNEINENNRKGNKTRILDLASGPSRYVLESITEENSDNVEAVCIDIDQESVNYGKIQSKNKPVRFIRGNVFSLQHLIQLSKKIGWTPNLVIASGLIYYHEDFKILKLFTEIANTIDREGTFLLSNMVSNPNRKLIGKLCKTKDGNAWIPLGREQSVVKNMLREAGFSDIASNIDRWKMYSIFLAKHKANKQIAVAKSILPTLQKKTIEFRNNSTTFRGEFCYEPSKPVKGIVIFIHGLGYSTKAYKISPETFLNKNFGFYSYNNRGHGGTVGEWTVDNAVDDLISCARWLKKLSIKKEYGEMPIFVFSHSTGAYVSTLAAKKEPNLIKGLSLVSPVTSIFESYLHWHETGYNKEVKPFFMMNGKIHKTAEKCLLDLDFMLSHKGKKLSNNPDFQFPYRYGLLKGKQAYNLIDAFLNSEDLGPKANSIITPTLIFKGEYDEVMPVENIRKFYAKLFSPNKKIINTPSTNHFQPDQWENIQSESASFFLECLFKKDYSKKQTRTI